MASQEEVTLKIEAAGQSDSEVETTGGIEVQSFYLTPDGLLKPVDSGRDSSKFCKAIELMKSTRRKGRSGSAASPSTPPKTRRAAAKKNEEESEEQDAQDPDFNADEAENTPVARKRGASKMRTCPYCTKPFSEKGLMRHIKNKHPEKVSEYAKSVPLEMTLWMCPYCELFLFTKPKLNQHVQLLHADKSDEFSVILDLDMSADNDESTEAAKRKADSTVAGAGDSAKKRKDPALNAINNTPKKGSRRSEYPKPCPDCGLMIDKSSRWFDHKKKHIPLEERKNHQCGYCDQLYTKRALEVHIKTMHPEMVPEEQRTWECRYCDRVFRRTNTRHYHELSHKQDGKKFFCDVCQYAFINRSQLRKHRLTHSNTSVRCSKCRFLFEDIEKLTAHCERVHPGDEVYGTINEVKDRCAPIQRYPKNVAKPITKTVKPQDIQEIQILDYDYESDDSNEANDMYERSQKAQKDGKEGEGEETAESADDGTDSTKPDFELFRCKLCNVFYRKKAALAEHCIEFHNDMMEKLVLAGL